MSHFPDFWWPGLAPSDCTGVDSTVPFEQIGPVGRKMFLVCGGKRNRGKIHWTKTTFWGCPAEILPGLPGLGGFGGEIALCSTSFSMISLFVFALWDQNGNVRKLRSGAPQFTHFLVRENIEEKVVNESINSSYVCSLRTGIDTVRIVCTTAVQSSTTY